MRLSDIEKTETLIGVFVSSFAKKGTTKIFIKMKAGNPKQRAVNADDVSLESSNENSPLKNKKLIIWLDNKKIPTSAGTEKKIPNFIDSDILAFASITLRSFTC